TEAGELSLIGGSLGRSLVTNVHAVLLSGVVLFETRASDGVNACSFKDRTSFGPSSGFLRFGRLASMATTEEIEVRRLDPGEAREQLDALAGVLADCVAGGA